MDFSDLKKIVAPIIQELDHATMLNGTTPHSTYSENNPLFSKLVLVNYQPTCENMLLDFKTKLQRMMPANVELHSLKLWETLNSFAEWYAEDNR